MSSNLEISDMEISDAQKETPPAVTTSARVYAIPVNSTLADVEKIYIVDTLERNEGNKTRTANELGITIKTLYNKLHAYGMIETKMRGVKNAINGN